MQVLGQIGVSCRQLRSLDVSSTSISDRGLELLSRKTEGDPPSQLTRLLLTDTYTSHYVLYRSTTIYLYSYTIHVRVIQASNDVNIFFTCHPGNSDGSAEAAATAPTGIRVHFPSVWSSDGIRRWRSGSWAPDGRGAEYPAAVSVD